LPDPPPPPPPPPPKEKPPDPQAAPKPQPQPDPTPKPPAPANEPLKMEGAAGTGPSAFAAGNVSRDYQGGPALAASGPGGGASLADRAAERLYASQLRQSLRDELERQLPPEAGEISSQFALWVSPEGRLQRWELDAARSEPERQVLASALDRSAQALRLPPPAHLTQPLRFRLTLRAGG
ncbi:TonB C-terminal domain-containing protein, partial [Ideonella livida]